MIMSTIGSDNGLALRVRQSTIQSNDGLISWRIYVSLGLYSLSGKTSYRKISWSLEAARLDVAMVVSPNFRAIGKV